MYRLTRPFARRQGGLSLRPVAPARCVSILSRAAPVNVKSEARRAESHPLPRTYSIMSNATYGAQSLFNLEGLVAVVTGGGTGIGFMIAKGLAENGAKVYITGRRKDVLENTASNGSVNGTLIPCAFSSIGLITRSCRRLDYRWTCHPRQAY